jgi:hypothetical protein
MSKFHINPATGEVGACRATKDGCPFGTADQHYTSKEAGTAAYEDSMKDQLIPGATGKIRTPKTDFRNESGEGYSFQSNSEGKYRWAWSESYDTDADAGQWRDSFSEVLREAADDWETNGAGGQNFASSLRAAATREDKATKAGLAPATVPAVPEAPVHEVVMDYRRKAGNTALEGYAIEKNAEGQYRWNWTESGDDEGSIGDWQDSPVKALREAAEDWDTNGDGSRNYASVLRGAATRLSKPKK